MRAMIFALGLGLTLPTPVMADMRMEQGVRVHRGPALTANNRDPIGTHRISAGEGRRMVVLDPHYGSGAASRRSIVPLLIAPQWLGGWRRGRP